MKKDSDINIQLLLINCDIFKKNKKRGSFVNFLLIFLELILFSDLNFVCHDIIGDLIQYKDMENVEYIQIKYTFQNTTNKSLSVMIISMNVKFVREKNNKII